MDKQTQEEAKTILALIHDAKKHTTSNDFNALFADCETLVAGLAWLISPLTEAEQEYRSEIVRLMEEESLSHNAAKEKARTGEAYRNYRKLEMVYKLADEQIKILKKFRSNLEQEYNRSYTV